MSRSPSSKVSSAGPVQSASEHTDAPRRLSWKERLLHAGNATILGSMLTSVAFFVAALAIALMGRGGYVPFDIWIVPLFISFALIFLLTLPMLLVFMTFDWLGKPDPVRARPAPQMTDDEAFEEWQRRIPVALRHQIRFEDTDSDSP